MRGKYYLSDSLTIYSLIRLVLLFITVTVISLNLQGQDIFEQNWQTEDDFKGAENNVKQSIVWLEENPMATVSNDTKAISEYILNWLTNVSYLSVTFDEIFLDGLTTKKYKFGEKFRVTYLFGKSYYVITNPDAGADDEAAASARGIEGMVKVYQELLKIDPSVKHKILERYSRLVRQEKIEAYAKSQLTKSKEL
ncbi:MAG: hypothetical protein DRI71_07085 [Bacteroidetes bacterium]|nr:MAG: hypothetical protein DRI71_07085 [Bacteroidota bacterium]